MNQSRRSRQLLPILLLVALPSPLAAGPELDPLRRLAIQEGGRIKPLDTFAREMSRRITGARAFGAESIKYGPDLKSRMDPTEWLLAMLVDPDKWRTEPVIRVTHAGLRDATKLPAGKDHYSYNDLIEHKDFMAAAEKVHEKLRADAEAKLDPIEREISTLYDSLGTLSAIFSGEGWRIVPHPDDPKATWYSLRDLESVPSPEIGRVRTLLYALIRSYQGGNRTDLGDAASALSRRLSELAPSVYPAEKDLRTEIHYNTFKPFRMAWTLYLLAFLALLTSLGMPSRWLAPVGFGFLGLGFVVHAYGMVLRMLISGRPPVTNMYESVIWVAWAAVLFALIFELIYKSRYFATCASAVAVISLVLADNVPILDGAIEPLVPVLRDNMWLTIHVLTITLSYGAFFLAMAIGHVILGLHFFAPKKGLLLRTLSDFVYRTLQVGTLLGIAGTLLGGWWASYSWGRFWGWDAKETSIFVAIMFYLAILHGRMVGWLRDFGTAVASVLGFLGVLWAWYGVNFVLGVGLHSYGFGSGGYAYVGGFVAFEVAVVLAAVLRQRTHRPAVPATTVSAPKESLQPAG
jgi:ABC-type transport system involved in cytochrome c biogenesis permease subunit